MSVCTLQQIHKIPKTHLNPISHVISNRKCSKTIKVFCFIGFFFVFLAKQKLDAQKLQKKTGSKNLREMYGFWCLKYFDVSKASRGISYITYHACLAHTYMVLYHMHAHITQKIAASHKLLGQSVVAVASMPPCQYIEYRRAASPS